MWLLDADIASLYRGNASYNKPCTLSIRGDTASVVPWLFWQTDCMVYRPGTQVVLDVKAAGGAGNWTSVEFFRGALKLGEITSGTSFMITVNDTAFSYYALTALAHYAAGNRPLAPVHFMVQPEAVTAARPAAGAPLRVRAQATVGTWDLLGRMPATGLRAPAAWISPDGSRDAALRVLPK